MMEGVELKEFLEEAGLNIESLQNGLLELEAGDADSRPETLSKLFRAAHSLKGASGMAGLERTTELTHALEEVLDALRNGTAELSQEMVDTLLSSVDLITAMIAAVANGEGESVETEDAIAALHAALPEKNGAPAFASTLPVSDDIRARMNSTDDLNLFVAENSPANVFELRVTLTGDAAKTRTLIRNLEANSEVIARFELGGTDAAFLVATYISEEEFLSKVDHPSIRSRNLRMAPVAEAESNEKSTYVDLFLSEASEEIDGLVESLLAIEKDAASSSINDAFRFAHRLKGGAAAMGYQALAALCHAMEDHLSEIRDGKAAAGELTVSRLLESCDAVRESLQSIRTGDGEPRALLSERTVRLTSAAPPGTPASLTEGTPSSDAAAWSFTAFEEAGLKEAAESGYTVRELRVAFDPSAPMRSARAELILTNIECLAEVLAIRPTRRDFQQSEPESLNVLFSSEAADDEVLRAAKVDSVREATVAPYGRRDDARAAASPAKTPVAAKVDDAPRPKQAPSESKVQQSIRVDLDKLDALMNMAGELVVVKARFQRLSEQLAMMLDMKELIWAVEDLSNRAEKLPDGGPVLASAQKLAVRIRELASNRAKAAELEISAQQLSRISASIQNGVMAARMLPVANVFNRFPRLVRDISRQFQKEVKLEISGEETELDKRVIDELGDPMTHLIRNSLDHGLESPADRVKAGKPAQGTLKLSAFREGSLVCIAVEDDGRGINRERVLARAKERGLLEPGVQLSDEEICKLIFLPGFSTAEKVSDISGRGVGMDIVKSRIEELKGTISIESEAGAGTRIILRIPLTLAILKALLVKDCGVMLAVPVEQITEIVKLKETDIKSVEGRAVTLIRNSVMQVFGLASALGLSTAGAGPAGGGFAFVVKAREGYSVFRVEELLGEEEVVVKALPDDMSHVEGLTGATILGDGRVALIVDAFGQSLRMEAKTEKR